MQQKSGRKTTESGTEMQAKPKKNDQVNFLYQDLIDQLNHAHPLLKLAGNFSGKYSKTSSTNSTLVRDASHHHWRPFRPYSTSFL